jgi:hypothetical protein
LATWLVVGFVTSSVAGALSAQALSCPVGELVLLANPTVTVVDGQGDAASEELRWAGLPYRYMEGPWQIALGEARFGVERKE